MQFARDALINSRGIEKAVRDHALITFQRRLDYFANELAATRFKKKQLSFRSHPGTLRGELQQFADRFANWRAARFAGYEKWNAQYLEAGGQQLHLGRFSATLRAFECDKRQPRHELDLQTKIDNCRTALS